MRRHARWLVPTLGGLLAGCVFPADGSVRSATYLGLVRVRLADRVGDVRAIDVRTLGLGFDGAAFVGWRAGQWVTADPADCRLLVIVRSGVEAEAVATLMASMEGQRPCIADFTRSLSREASPPSR